MYCLTEQQIDFILNDIKNRGVELPDLQQNLLDHICCVIENEYKEDLPFETFYKSVVQRFYVNSLQEIEEETKLLITFKHYYFMKKLMVLSGIFSAVSLIFGIAFKFMYWPGASILLILGIVSLCLLFLPLYFVLKIKNESLIKNKILVGITLLVCVAFSFSVLFKVQHWPGANMLGLLSMALMVGVFLPIYFITGYKNSETRVSTIASSVLIIAGCALLLTLVRTPHATKLHGNSITMQIANSEELFQHMWLQHQAQLDTNGLSLIKTCNAIKQHVYEQETGFKNFDNVDVNERFIQDGAMVDYFNNNTTMQQLQNDLQEQVKLYNNQQQTKGRLNIPTYAAMVNKKEHSIQTGLNNLLTIQLIVMHNAGLDRNKD